MQLGLTAEDAEGAEETGWIGMGGLLPSLPLGESACYFKDLNSSEPSVSSAVQ